MEGLESTFPDWIWLIPFVVLIIVQGIFDIIERKGRVWLPILGFMATAAIIGVKAYDLPEIFAQAYRLCLSCIGIG